MNQNVLPENDTERGEILLATCLLDYFPNACAAVARHSAKSNEKHNPGQPPHWARDKSTDHRNKIARHLIDAGGFDKDGNRHSVALAWRGLALLEDELIAEGAAPGRNAIGSPDNTARRLYDETSAIAAAQDAKLDSIRAEPAPKWSPQWLAEQGIPAESTYIASFRPNGSRIVTPAEIAELRKVLTAEQLREYGIGDAEPRNVAGIATNVATSQHPANAEAIRYHDERLDGPEDRL